MEFFSKSLRSKKSTFKHHLVLTSFLLFLTQRNHLNSSSNRITSSIFLSLSHDVDLSASKVSKVLDKLWRAFLSVALAAFTNFLMNLSGFQLHCINQKQCNLWSENWNLHWRWRGEQCSKIYRVAANFN